MLNLCSITYYSYDYDIGGHFMSLYKYTPKGVCSRQFEIDIDNGIINSLVIHGGCAGNTTGICALVKGMDAQSVIDKLKGIHCGPRPTSCPDQVARALEEVLEKEKNA